MPPPLDKVDLSELDILLIDDNKFIRLLLGDVLRSFGVGTVREASSADQALEKIHQHRPDIILCDWMMDPPDGLALLRKIRSVDGAQRVPVIMITGHATLRSCFGSFGRRRRQLHRKAVPPGNSHGTSLESHLRE